MQTPNVKTTKDVVPMIYAYTTPGVTYHDGYTKIGYTEQDVNVRIDQQTHTAWIKYKKEWQGNAIFDDGSGEVFSDTLFHAYLRKNGIKQPIDLVKDGFDGKDKNEWFFISPNDSRTMFYEFRSNRGILEQAQEIIPYILRDEQEQAVSITKAYKESHEKGEFLWNAKPRFGKTLAVYDFMKKIGAKSVLIVTNRPAIANSWYSDYAKFIGRKSGYFFVSDVDGIKNKPYVISYNEYQADKKSRESKKKDAIGLIDFVSLQGLKGSIYFGGKLDKLKEIKDITWDLLVIDEAHEGVDTYKTDVAFDKIKRNFTLHLSGTPFKALANNKFADDAIFNYTYTDEQTRKRDWDDSSEIENPYAILPKLNLFTYQMSEIVRDELSQGIEIKGETEEFAFDLNEFFKVENGKFVHNSSVDKFLDALTKQTKFPFSTEELRNELKHTFWLLDRVESARLMAKKLSEHPIFQDYEIVLAAGDGRIDDDDENEKSFDKVVNAIKSTSKKELSHCLSVSLRQVSRFLNGPAYSCSAMLSPRRFTCKRPSVRKIHVYSVLEQNLNEKKTPTYLTLIRQER